MDFSRWKRPRKIPPGVQLTPLERLMWEEGHLRALPTPESRADAAAVRESLPPGVRSWLEGELEKLRALAELIYPPSPPESQAPPEEGPEGPSRPR